jgi:hypothetical protein
MSQNLSLTVKSRIEIGLTMYSTQINKASALIFPRLIILQEQPMKNNDSFELLSNKYIHNVDAKMQFHT